MKSDSSKKIGKVEGQARKTAQIPPPQPSEINPNRSDSLLRSNRPGIAQHSRCKEEEKQISFNEQCKAFSSEEYTQKEQSWEQLNLFSLKGQEDLIGGALQQESLSIAGHPKDSALKPLKSQEEMEFQTSKKPKKQDASSMSLSGQKLSDPKDKIEKRRKKRKTLEQIQILRNAFQEQEGGLRKEQIKELAEQTNLSEKEIYKWSWEQKRQMVSKMKMNNVFWQAGMRVPKTDEFGGYAKLDFSPSHKQNQIPYSQAESLCVEDFEDDIDQYLIGAGSKRKASDESSLGAQQEIRIQELAELIGIDIEHKLKEIIGEHNKTKLEQLLDEIPSIKTSEFDENTIQSERVESEQERSEEVSDHELECLEQIQKSPARRNTSQLNTTYQTRLKDYYLQSKIDIQTRHFPEQ